MCPRFTKGLGATFHGNSDVHSSRFLAKYPSSVNSTQCKAGNNTPLNNVNDHPVGGASGRLLFDYVQDAHSRIGLQLSKSCLRVAQGYLACFDELLRPALEPVEPERQPSPEATDADSDCGMLVDHSAVTCHQKSNCHEKKVEALHTLRSVKREPVP